MIKTEAICQNVGLMAARRALPQTGPSFSSVLLKREGYVAHGISGGFRAFRGGQMGCG